jgi:hypothetical protein
MRGAVQLLYGNMAQGKKLLHNRTVTEFLVFGIFKFGFFQFVENKSVSVPPFKVLLNKFDRNGGYTGRCAALFLVGTDFKSWSENCLFFVILVLINGFQFLRNCRKSNAHRHMSGSLPLPF